MGLECTRRNVVLWFVCRSLFVGTWCFGSSFVAHYFVICGTFFARTRAVVIVNFSPAALVARVAGKEGGAGARMLQELLAGRDCLLRDRLSEFTTDIYGDTFTGARASARGEG